MEMSENDRNIAIGSYKGSCILPNMCNIQSRGVDTNEKLFYVTGKSGVCITEPKGCECPMCPLTQSIDVGVVYHTYCFKWQ